MAVTPNSVVLPQAVLAATALCTAAKTTYNDSANAVRLIAAAGVSASNGNGALVKRLFAIPRGTVTATQLQVYRLSPDTGSTLMLAESALMAAFTMGQTAAAPKTDFGYSDTAPLRLGRAEELWVAIGVAASSGVVFIAEYEAY